MTDVPDSRHDLAYRPPLDWPSMLAFLATRAIEGVEEVSATRYRRTIRIDDGDRTRRGRVGIEHDPTRACLVVTLDPALEPVAAAVLERLRRLFDLDADPRRIAAALGEAAMPRPGLRLPGAVDGFEIGVRAVLGQQITVKAARTLAGRLVREFGEPLGDSGDSDDNDDSGALTHSFPRPRDLAVAGPETSGGADVEQRLMALGLPRQRARTLIGFAAALADGRIDLDQRAARPGDADPTGVDPESLVEQLQTLSGIGPWTAHYIAMRALGWSDAFPASDLGVLKALGTRRPREAIDRAEAWRPWRAYAVIQLWMTVGTPNAAAAAPVLSTTSSRTAA